MRVVLCIGDQSIPSLRLVGRRDEYRACLENPATFTGPRKTKDTKIEIRKNKALPFASIRISRCLPYPIQAWKPILIPVATIMERIVSLPSISRSPWPPENLGKSLHVLVADQSFQAERDSNETATSNREQAEDFAAEDSRVALEITNQLLRDAQQQAKRTKLQLRQTIAKNETLSRQLQDAQNQIFSLQPYRKDFTTNEAARVSNMPRKVPTPVF